MPGSLRPLLPVALFLLLVLGLSACGARPQPTAQPQATARPTALPTEMPRPTAALPTTPPAGTPSSAGDIAAAYENLRHLPGYRFEGTYKSEENGQLSGYLRVVQDVDAQGNLHLVAYDRKEGAPSLEIYYVGRHLYFVQGGQLVDLGEQDAEQAATLYQVYYLPFYLAMVGASDLQPVGQESVNGLAATRYRARFDEYVRAYLQLHQGVTYSAEGSIWISNQYGAILKSEVHVRASEGTRTSEFASESEVSQVGRVPPVQVPK